MKGAVGRRAVIAVIVGLVVGLGGLVAQPAARAGGRDDHRRPVRQGDELYGCDRTFGRQPVGRLHKTTTPPADARVAPGDTIDVDLVWAVGDWSAPQLHKVLDCVAIDGRLVPPFQAGESPTDNDGRFRRSYRVPDDAPAGSEICDQAMLSGPSPRGDYDRQISNMVCHTVTGRTAADRPPCGDRCGGGRGCSDCYEKAPPEDRSGGGRGCPDCYEKAPPEDRSGGGRGCPDCYEKAPPEDRSGSGRGCPDCYQKAPPEDRSGGGRGCPDCYEKAPNDGRGCPDCYDKPPAKDRCGDRPSCGEAPDRCRDKREPCERRGNGGGRDCRCDKGDRDRDDDRDGSFLHRALRHIFH